MQKRPERATSAPLPHAPLLALEGICKAYGSTQAARDVSFALYAGEVLALVGENGAGKSTIMGVLSGAIVPDAGLILIAGEARRLSSPYAAQSAGIGTVFQELSLVGNLTVKENLFAGRAPTRFGLVDRHRMRVEAQALMDRMGVTIDPDARVADLPMSSRQIVEIAKALSLDARILLLDEPSSALNAGEKELLFNLVAKLKAAGVGIIYISHHLNEVMALADSIIVMRSGSVVARLPQAEARLDDIVRHMVGHPVGAAEPLPATDSASPLLVVDELSGRDQVETISFTLAAGEILAVAGLVGSGRDELARLILGLERRRAGRMSLGGRPLALKGIAQAKRRGIGYVPPERKSEGLFLDLSVAANIAAASLEKTTVCGLLSDRRMTRLAAALVTRLRIKGAPGTSCRALSGGNQQKVLLAKWLARAPRLLVVEEPTKGVDVAAKEDIHRALRELAAKGTALLMISSDLPEILQNAHRVLVMRRGRVVADLACATTSEREIIAHAAGV